MTTINRPKRIRMTVASLATSAAIIASGCGNSLSADASSSSSTEEFCKYAVEDWPTYGDGGMTEDGLEELNEKAKEIRERTPADAPPEVAEYIDTFIEFTGGDLEKLASLVEEESLTELERQEEIFTEYIDSTCNEDGTVIEPASGDSDRSDDASPTGETRPVQATEPATIVTDGPAGNYEAVTIDIGEINTTNDPVGFVKGEPQNPTEQAHLVAAIDLESGIDSANRFQAGDFKLRLSDGTVIAATSVLDNSGDVTSPSLQGKDSTSLVAVFETDTLIQDVTGVSVGIERDGDVPLYLPLDGEAGSTYPLVLESGQTAQIAGEHVTGKCDTLFDAKVASAEVQLETFADVTETGRVSGQTRFVAVTLEMTNVTDVQEDTASERQTCGFYSGQLVKTNIRLLVDDKPQSNKTAAFRWPSIDIGSAENIELLYEVPIDTEEITLIGHEDDDVIASWELNAPPVLGEA